MIQWYKQGSFLDQIRAIYTGYYGSLSFRIVEDTVNHCKVEVNGKNIGYKILGIEKAKMYCLEYAKR